MHLLSILPLDSLLKVQVVIHHLETPGGGSHNRGIRGFRGHGRFGRNNNTGSCVECQICKRYGHTATDCYYFSQNGTRNFNTGATGGTNYPPYYNALIATPNTIAD